ncbi:FAD/FMN-containing dehydrogenase [Rheinheimera pacifica]|uniref:FAD-binding oxidoreductase n=1 Tax=Rheinheimera pacifica TaxID=173990 RepID=UPI0028641BDE|nr:FAD-binding oxidoreductase [Rheinheimera pacifica]MDR6984121.1 FAD/FMN-containing dehydrogenase [Rheinheimera pacifica]
MTEPKQQTTTLIVNDITLLNPIAVAKIVTPQSEAELVQQLVTSSGAVSVGGGRYSQGGQVALPDSLHIDMRSYNNIVSFEPDKKQITVQAGITWRDIQTYIDAYELSVKIMQSYADFTVGGSLSVNAHGRYIGEGPLINSVLAIRLLLADGSVITATPDTNRELFYAAIGGYGAMGIILEASLQLTDNCRVQRQVASMATQHYREFFQTQIRDNSAIVFHNAVLYPPQYNQIAAVSWLTTDNPVTVDRRLLSPDTRYWWQPALTDFVADYDFAKRLRQHWLDPLLYRQPAVHWRNYEASYDVRELEPADRTKQTFGLREYFVPVDKFDAFVKQLAAVLQQNHVNVLNVSVRHALPDKGSVLAWASQEIFAFVVYYRQGTDEQARQHTELWSQQLIEAVLAHGGTYYLPYQPSATPEQFQLAYPRAAEFFQLKQQYDPQNRFNSQFWSKYLAPFAAGI